MQAVREAEGARADPGAGGKQSHTVCIPLWSLLSSSPGCRREEPGCPRASDLDIPGPDPHRQAVWTHEARVERRRKVQSYR